MRLYPGTASDLRTTQGQNQRHPSLHILHLQPRSLPNALSRLLQRRPVLHAVVPAKFYWSFSSDFDTMTAVMGSQQIYEVQHSGQTQQLTFSSPRPAQAQPPRLGRQSIDLRSLPLAQRLSCIPGALAARFEPGTLALVQVRPLCTTSLRLQGWQLTPVRGLWAPARNAPPAASFCHPARPFKLKNSQSGVLIGRLRRGVSKCRLTLGSCPSRSRAQVAGRAAETPHQAYLTRAKPFYGSLAGNEQPDASRGLKYLRQKCPKPSQQIVSSACAAADCGSSDWRPSVALLYHVRSWRCRSFGRSLFAGESTIANKDFGAMLAADSLPAAYLCSNLLGSESLLVYLPRCGRPASRGAGRASQ